MLSTPVTWKRLLENEAGATVSPGFGCPSQNFRGRGEKRKTKLPLGTNRLDTFDGTLSLPNSSWYSQRNALDA